MVTCAAPEQRIGVDRVRAGTIIAASATPFVREQLAGRAGACTILGAFPTAVYLELSTGAVIGVLTSDAVALPLGLVLPTSSAAQPLDGYRSRARIQAEVLELGDLRVAAGRSRPSRPWFVGPPVRRRIDEAWARLRPTWDRTGLDARSVAALRDGSGWRSIAGTVAELLGRGPGLTPAGDDLLCGFLAGDVAFGRERNDVRSAVLTRLRERPCATTSLSRQLLRLACDGNAIDEVISFARALCGEDPAGLERAVDGLVGVGHSSGAALAFGVLAADPSPA